MTYIITAYLCTAIFGITAPGVDLPVPMEPGVLSCRLTDLPTVYEDIESCSAALVRVNQANILFSGQTAAAVCTPVETF